jgi:DNA processing protein
MAALIDIDSLDIDKLDNNNFEAAEFVDGASSTQKSTLETGQQQLLEQMGFDSVPIDDLVLRTGLPVEQVSAMLLILELQDYVSTSGSGTYTRLK